MNPTSFKKNLRLFVSPCRSGSSVILQILSQSTSVEATYQTIKHGIREHGTPNYSIFYEDQPNNKLLISKETIGWRDTKECTYQVFPDVTSIIVTKPFFIFREPIDTWNSWSTSFKNSSIDLFCKAYRHTLSMYQHAKKEFPDTRVLLFTDFKKTPLQKIKNICNHWDISFDTSMLTWDTPYSYVDVDQQTRQWITQGLYKPTNDMHHIHFEKHNNIIISKPQQQYIREAFEAEYNALVSDI